MNRWQYAYANLALAEVALREELLPKIPWQWQTQAAVGSGSMKGPKSIASSGQSAAQAHSPFTCRQLVTQCWQEMVADFTSVCCSDEDAVSFDD